MKTVITIELETDDTETGVMYDAEPTLEDGSDNPEAKDITQNMYKALHRILNNCVESIEDQLVEEFPDQWDDGMNSLTLSSKTTYKVTINGEEQ